MSKAKVKEKMDLLEKQNYFFRKFLLKLREEITDQKFKKIIEEALKINM